MGLAEPIHRVPSDRSENDRAFSPFGREARRAQVSREIPDADTLQLGGLVTLQM
jgi:hypothetical protein